MFRLLLLIWFVNSHNPGLVHDWKVYDGHAYAFIDQSATWDDASDLCSSLYMDMATPTSDAELEFLEEAVYNGEDDVGNLNSWFWIGAYNEHVDSKVTAYQAARGWYWARWAWDNGETWSYQDFDGEQESGNWGYDNYGAALVVTDFDSAASSTYNASWRIAPANNSYKVVCESR
jgi:hypothetical protein